MLAGDLNVVPTKADIYNEWLWRLETRRNAGFRMDFLLLTPDGCNYERRQ